VLFRQDFGLRVDKEGSDSEGVLGRYPYAVDFLISSVIAWNQPIVVPA
jgi:hypothetical protein